MNHVAIRGNIFIHFLPEVTFLSFHILKDSFSLTINLPQALHDGGFDYKGNSTTDCNNICETTKHLYQIFNVYHTEWQSWCDNQTVSPTTKKHLTVTGYLSPW